MNKKNTYIRKTLIVLYLIVTPSFYLFSSYQPAGKRDRNYAGPMRIRQKPRKPVAQPQLIEDKKDILAPAKIDQPIQNREQPVAEPTTTSDTMQAKAAASSPGMLMTAYIVFLSTLNKAFGVGVEQSYKPLIQNWVKRQEVLNAKNEIPEQAKKLVESGKFDKDVLNNAENLIKIQNIAEDSPEFNKLLLQVRHDINLPSQQKITITTEKMLKKLEPLEKQVSFGSIASQTIYLGLFNTAARVVGGLIGFGATMLLQSLMPQSE